jgi:hypothetical protein
MNTKTEAHKENLKSTVLNKYRPFSTIKIENYSPAFKIGIIALGVITILILCAFGIRVIQETTGNLKNYTNFCGISLQTLEPFSILLGLLSIILSVIIFIYVKNETDDRQNEFDQQIKRIDDSVEKVLTSHTSLVEVHGLTKKLEIIEEIYNMTEKSNNMLYVMTHSVTYGNILAHQVKSLWEDKDISKIGITTVGQFYLHVMKPILIKINNLSEKLIGLPKNAIKVMVIQEEKYESMVRKVAENHDIKLFEKYSDEIFNYEQYKNHYFVNVDDVENDSKEFKRKVFEKKLSEFNRRKYKEIEKAFVNNYVNKKRVNRLPFQFIASIPKNNSLGGKMKCLVIFTNMYSGSTIDTVTCFSSENEKLIFNLQDIYDSIERVHDESKKNTDTFQRIFGFKETKEICFVMHETIMKDVEETAFQDSIVRFRDDVIAETKFKQLFNKKYKDCQINEEFISDEKYSSLIEKYNCIVNIGLFKNKLTEEFCSDKSISTQHFDIKTESNKKTIKVHKGIPGDLRKDWTSFVSNFHPEKTDSHDVGIFAKVLYKNKNVIICGGCESYGTRKMGEYILDNWKEMLENHEDKFIKANYLHEQFISVYKIPHEDSKAKISLIHHYSR